jgi:hypothetical protein
MCALLVVEPEITVLGVADQSGQPLQVHIETLANCVGCSDCGSRARVKDRRRVTLVAEDSAPLANSGTTSGRLS